MKLPLTTKEMLDLLEERGLVIEDRASAGATLLNANYYRLSGFFRQLQRDPQGGDPRFVEGASFSQVVRLHQADRLLARLCLQPLSEIECVIRSRLAYFAAQRSGSGAFYLEPGYYYDFTPGLDDHLSRIARELRSSKSPMVTRYRMTDGDVSAVPVWVAVEVLPFGTVSRMIEHAADSTAARQVAHSLSLQWDTFPSTVHSLAVFRNRCAHHGQNWHRRLDVQTPRKKSELRHVRRHHAQGVYPAILALRRFAKASGASLDPLDEIEELLSRDPEYAAGILWPDPK